MDVTITNLVKRYGGFGALNGISLHIGPGMFGLLGPNGAGKTTFMRILTGLIPPTAGEVTVGGINVAREPERVRPHIGYLPQDFGFYRDLNAYELLDYIAIMKSVPTRERKRQIDTVLEQVNLGDAARRRVGGYSGGMKQRLGIAQALLGNPALLVVDEPTAGLDPEERIRFRNLLARLASDRTVILSTHIVSDVEASCNALAVMRRGRLAFSGTLDELRQAAHSLVWELEAAPADLSLIESRYRVVASRPGRLALHLRVISAENPLGRGMAVEPGLEEGYLAVMGTEREALGDE